MAGNANSGNKLNYSHGEAQTAKLIQRYKDDLAAGVFERASWPHFCAYLGYTEEEVREVIEQGKTRTSTYYNRSLDLRRMDTWIKGQMISGSGWSSANQSIAAMLLRQDNGNGTAYDSKETAKGPAKLTISFGGDDKRARRAAK